LNKRYDKTSFFIRLNNIVMQYSNSEIFALMGCDAASNWLLHFGATCICKGPRSMVEDQGLLDLWRWAW